MIDVLRYIEKMKEMYEGERITAQEPRNMYQDGQLVRPTVDGSRPGYMGEDKITELAKKYQKATGSETTFNTIKSKKFNRIKLEAIIKPFVAR